MSNKTLTPGVREARALRAAVKAARAAALAVAIDVQDLDDASIEAEADKLADLWDAGTHTRVAFAMSDAWDGAPAPAPRLPGDIRRNVARFDSVMKLRGYPAWIDHVCDDGSGEPGSSDEVRRNSLRRVLAAFNEDTMRHTVEGARRASRQRRRGGDAGRLSVDLFLSAEHVLDLHSDRVAMIDRALKACTAPEERAVLEALRIAEFKAMLDIIEPHLGDEGRAGLRSLAITTFCKRADKVTTSAEAAPWLEFAEQVLLAADELPRAELEAVLHATTRLLALSGHPNSK
jgi:hypothetical protein